MANAPSERTGLLADDASDDSRSDVENGSDLGSGGMFKASYRSLRNFLQDNVLDHTGEIGMLGSVSIAVNSLTGPAMLNLPATFQQSGFIPTITALLFSCALSAMCSLHTANTISKVPGNHDFKKEIEYGDLFREFLGVRWFYFSQLLFFCCISCLNVSSIVDTAQVVDTMLGHWFQGGSAAFLIMYQEGQVQFEWVRWDYSACSQHQVTGGECIPFFEEDGFLLTAGYLLSMTLLLPLALMDLKENSMSQILGFVILVLCCIQFSITFIANGLDTSNVSLWGTSWDSLMGVIIFNFALVLAIPAWLYEKRESVNTAKVINGSSIMSVVLYITIGGLGALAVPNVSDNMLESMMSGELGALTQFSASAFAFFIIGFGVPLFSVLTRLSLTGTGICGNAVANIPAVYVPFAASWIFYKGAAITRLLSWGGVIFTSLVAFILPLIVTLYALDADDLHAGSIDVYGGVWEFNSKLKERRFLYILLAAAVASICMAMIGNVLG